MSDQTIGTPVRGEDGVYRVDGNKIVGRKIADAQGRPKWVYTVNHESGTMSLATHYDYTDEFERSEMGGEHTDGPMTDEWIFEEVASHG